MLIYLYWFKYCIISMCSVLTMVWTFGGFGIDKAFTLWFFYNLFIFTDSLVLFLGNLLKGGYVLLNLCFVRSIMNIFLYPWWLFILNGFVIRIATLKGAFRFRERLRFVDKFIFLLTLLQFFKFWYNNMLTMENSALRSVNETYFYVFEIERGFTFNLMKLFWITYSFLISLFFYVWTGGRFLFLSMIAVTILVWVSILWDSLLAESILPFMHWCLALFLIKNQVFICDIEESRDKLERFFNYNFIVIE